MKIQKNSMYPVAIAIVLLALMMAGCKKDEDVLNPDIVFKTYNISLTNTTSAVDPDQEVPFDLDGDGSDDFKFDAEFQNVGGDTTITEIDIQSVNSDNKVLTEEYVFPGGQTSTKLKALSNGYMINSASEFNEFGFAVLTAKVGSVVMGDFGFTDTSDKLVGFSFYIGSDLHYGWLKVKVSADLKTLTIKEGAYHKMANMGIAAGDK